MALSLSNDFSMDAGGREFRFYTVTHDATTFAVSAHLLDLSHIDWIGNMGTIVQSDIASVANEVVLSIVEGPGGSVVDMNAGALLVAGDKTRIMVIGW